MSRANYCDDLDQWDMIRWRGQVASAIRGKRGQTFLRDLLAALDGLADKRLIKDELITEEGDVCAIGALGLARGIEMKDLDPEEPETVAAAHRLHQPHRHQPERRVFQHRDSRTALYGHEEMDSQPYQNRRSWEHAMNAEYERGLASRPLVEDRPVDRLVPR